MDKREKGFVLPNPVEIDGKPHRFVWFPLVIESQDQTVPIPEEDLRNAGVDISLGTDSLVEATVEGDATTADQLNPRDLEDGGVLRVTDQDLSWMSKKVIV
jgi:hypothetical protein